MKKMFFFSKGDLLAYSFLLWLFPVLSNAQQAFKKEKMDSILAHFPAKIGIAAWFQPKQTTELKTIYSFHPTDSFISMSTIKLPIAIACLKEIEKGNIALTKRVLYTSQDLLTNTYSPMRDSVNNAFETTLNSCLLYAC